MRADTAVVIFPGLGGSLADWRAAVPAAGLGGRVVTAPGDRPWVALGHSQGAVRALEAAAADPDRARGVVITAGFFPPARAGRPLPAAVADYAAHRAAYVRSLAARGRRPRPTRSAGHQLARLARLGLRPSRFHALASSVSCPVLVIHSDDDHVVPIAFALAAAARHPAWELLVLPGGGHVPQRDHPGEWAALAESWLASLDG